MIWFCIQTHAMLLGATLDEGPRFKVQWNKAILLVENHKYGPKGPRPTSDKLRLNLHSTYFGGKINWFKPPQKKNKRAQKGAHDLRTKMEGVGSKEGSNSRIQFASNGSKLVPTDLDIGFWSKVGLSLEIFRPPRANLQWCSICTWWPYK
jgi:hypothetical protein